MQNMISSGSDFKGRPQDEGYRPNKGTATERAMLEGAYDSGSIIENTGPRTKQIVKTQDKPPKPPKSQVDSKPAAKTESAPAAKATPVDETKLSLTERLKLSRDRAKSGSGPTDTRSVNQRLRSALGMKKGGAAKKMASGGMVSSASKRADGIATKGKTRGKMC